MHLQTHKAAPLQAPYEWKPVNNPKNGKNWGSVYKTSSGMSQQVH